MNLSEMEAIATDLQGMVQDLQSRIGELESHPPESFAPINTYYINPEGKTINTTSAAANAMTWEGQWDRESAYTVGDVVRWNKKLYIAISDVPEFVAPGLGPGPHGIGEEKGLWGPLPPLGRIVEEEAGGLLEETHTPYYAKSKENPVPSPQVWEFRSGEGFITLPQPAPGIHMDVYNDNNVRILGNFTKFVGNLLAPYGTGSGVFYLVVWQNETPLPIEYNLNLTGTAIISTEGNKNPATAPNQWSPIP